MIEYRGYTIKHYKHYGLAVFYNNKLITLSSQPVAWIDLEIDYFNQRQTIKKLNIK
jgi:hypothetical protein